MRLIYWIISVVISHKMGAELNTQATKTCWRNISTFTVAFAGILYFRVYMTSTNFSPTFSDVDNYIHYIENDLNRVLTYGFLHAKYALTLAMPVHLSCDWSYEAFRLCNLCTIKEFSHYLYV